MFQSYQTNRPRSSPVPIPTHPEGTNGWRTFHFMCWRSACMMWCRIILYHINNQLQLSYSSASSSVAVPFCAHSTRRPLHSPSHKSKTPGLPDMHRNVYSAGEWAQISYVKLFGKIKQIFAYFHISFLFLLHPESRCLMYSFSSWCVAKFDCLFYRFECCSLLYAADGGNIKISSH